MVDFPARHVSTGGSRQKRVLVGFPHVNAEGPTAAKCRTSAATNREQGAVQIPWPLQSLSIPFYPPVN